MMENSIPSIYDGINSGRDTDSMDYGDRCGGLLGAMFGEKVVKKEDIEVLQETNKINLFEVSDRY